MTKDRKELLLTVLFIVLPVELALLVLHLTI